MMTLYSFGLALALALSAPVWGSRMLRQSRYRKGLPHRLGRVPDALLRSVADRPVVWVHAVSVGETMAATRLVREIEAALPEYAVVISTTTPTGQQVARERFGAERVFFYPLDFRFAVRVYLQALRPSLLVLMESELWPRMLIEAERSGIPVAVVNARVSDRSYPRYLGLRWLWRPLLGRLSLLLAQTEADANRWRSIGAPADIVRTSGNLKYDVRASGESALCGLLRARLPQGAPVLVAGSTHPGEEALLLDCCNQMGHDAVMLLAPRHPQRAAEVVELAHAKGVRCERVSAWRAAPGPITPGSVLVLDTVGELAPLYALAQTAFVGGSLVPSGGHNPLEPAQFAVPVVMGPHFENFREIVESMRAANAITITPADDLCRTMEQHLQCANREGGERARTFFEAQSGATERTVAALCALVHGRQA